MTVNYEIKSFLDREKTTDLYKNIYGKINENHGEILYFHGVSGIGKFRLVKELATNNKNLAYVDLNDGQCNEQEEVFTKIAKQLVKYDKKNYRFQFLLYVISKNKEAHQDDTKAKIGGDKLDMGLVSQITDIASIIFPEYEKIYSIANIVADNSEFFSKIYDELKKQKYLKKDEELINEIDKFYGEKIQKNKDSKYKELLTKCFRKDLELANKTANNKATIFFYGYEHLEDLVSKKEDIDWLFGSDFEYGLLNSPINNILFIVTGWNKIKKQNVLSIELDKIPDKYIVEYLKKHEKIGNKKVINSICKATEGIPIFLELALKNFYMNKDESEAVILNNIGSNTNQLTSRYIKYLDENEKSLLRYMALIERWHDGEFSGFIKEELIDPSDTGQMLSAYNKLKNRSYIRKEGIDYFIFHHRIREAILEDEQFSMKDYCAKKLIRYYSKITYKAFEDDIIQAYQSSDYYCKTVLNVFNCLDASTVVSLYEDIEFKDIFNIKSPFIEPELSHPWHYDLDSCKKMLKQVLNSYQVLKEPKKYEKVFFEYIQSSLDENESYNAYKEFMKRGYEFKLSVYNLLYGTINKLMSVHKYKEIREIVDKYLLKFTKDGYYNTSIIICLNYLVDCQNKGIINIFNEKDFKKIKKMLMTNDNYQYGFIDEIIINLSKNLNEKDFVELIEEFEGLLTEDDILEMSNIEFFKNNEKYYKDLLFRAAKSMYQSYSSLPIVDQTNAFIEYAKYLPLNKRKNAYEKFIGDFEAFYKKIRNGKQPLFSLEEIDKDLVKLKIVYAKILIDAALYKEALDVYEKTEKSFMNVYKNKEAVNKYKSRMKECKEHLR